MTDPTFGISITTPNDEPLPVITANMSVIGIVDVSENADPVVFPLDAPVSMFSTDLAKLEALGADSPIYRHIQAINSQLGERQVSAQLIVVRVAEGDSDSETIANIRGDVNARTGMFALLDAAAEHGITPRILLPGPGLTGKPLGQINSVITVTNGGSLYTAAPTVVFTGGGSDPDKVLPTATAVLGTGPDAGKVVAITVTDAGENLTAAPSISFTGGGGGSGAAATATLDDATNAIVASLPTLCDRLSAVALVDGPNSTQSAAINWRESIASKRIIPVDPAYKVLDADGNIAVVPASPYVAGIAVRVDHEFAGVPSHSWANRAVRGIVGTARPIGFSIVDGATEGQQLLAANIGTTVRGERTDDSIADGGYVFIGTDTAYGPSEQLWMFYNQVRMRDYIHLGLIRTVRNFLGQQNLTGHAIQAVINTMNFFLRDLQAQNHILGGITEFIPDQNSPEQLRLGKLRVAFRAEEPAPLRYLGIESRRYREALEILLTDLTAQLDLGA